MFRSGLTPPAVPSPVLLALTLTTALSSCETESPTGNATRDTLPNGALLVRYPNLPAFDAIGPDVYEAQVDLKFGSLEGDDPNLTFGAVRGVQAASDGTIYVLDQQAAEVRRFIKPVMSYGYMWNGTFDRRGRYWKETSHWDDQPSFPPPMGLSSIKGRRYYKSYDLSSGAIDSVYLGEISGRSYAYSTPDVRWGFLDIRFEASEVVVVNPSGGLWRANSAAYRIARIGEGGDTLVVIEAGLPVQPVTDEDRSAYIEGIVGNRPELRREAEEVAALMPDVKPILAGIFADDEDRLWVQRVTPDDAPAFYDLFSEDGDYLGSVRLGFVAAGPLWVRHGQIYSWTEDDLEVPYVARAPTTP